MKMFQRYHKEMFGTKSDAIVQNAQFVDVTPCSDWWFTERGKNAFEFDNAEFPVMTSPAPLLWLEYTMPSRCYLDGKIQNTGLPPTDVGMTISQWEIPVDEANEVLKRDDGMRYAIQLGVFRASDFSDELQERRRATLLKLADKQFLRWIVMSSVYVNRAGKISHLANLLRYLDDTGKPFEHLSFAGIAKVNSNETEAAALLRSVIAPFLFAISLMHCKNVKLEDVAVPPKVQAKREKQGAPKITFKTLVVEPLRQQIRRETAKDPTGEQNHIKRALHIARGHFKDYRDGPGLFGKYHGLFWWDMQVRGNADAGIVAKDYKIKC
jgi:hypothetical protein